MSDGTNDVRERLQETARAIATILPPHTGFVLLAFDFGGGGRLEYVSNAQRADVVKAMREFIARTEAGWGQHLPESPTSPTGLTCQTTEEGLFYTLTEKSITCLKCGRTSYHPDDVAHRYCGFCHQFYR